VLVASAMMRLMIDDDAAIGDQGQTDVLLIFDATCSMLCSVPPFYSET
jgi:hypothetical protein